MKNKNKLLLGALVVLLGVIFALWPTQVPPSEPHRDDSARQPATVVPNQPRIPPVARQPVPETALGGLEPERKFAKMGVLERGAIQDKIGKLELPQIFQAMLDADRVEHDSMKQMHLQTVFFNALIVKKPTLEFMEQMFGFVVNTANSKFERDLLIGALQGAGTKDSVDLLIRIANTASDPETRGSAATLAGIGSLRQNGAEISPVIERAWRTTGNPTLIISTADALAKFGLPSGIELLLSSALATDDRDKVRQQAALSALEEVYKGVAVPPLAARLKDQPPTSEAVKLVAPILARTSGPDGHVALVEWLRSRPENAAPLVDDLIRQQIRTDPFKSAWAKAVDPSVSFTNEENRKAIREALDAYRAGRQSGP